MTGSRTSLRKECVRRLGLVLVAVLVCGGAGCEENSDVIHEDGPPPVFRIDPSDSTLNAGETQLVLEAVGGHPPFTWTASDATLGAISGDTGDATIVNYNRTGASSGVNVIEIVDRRGWSAHATIRQTND